jgi:dihydroorotate dehydrogenase
VVSPKSGNKYMLEIPFYNPLITYQENYDKGPFGVFIKKAELKRKGPPQCAFLGHKIYLPFGIPAGPLVNARFVSAAFNNGFDICVYKTVRTREYPCHPWPNVLAIHENQLEIDHQEPLIADYNYSEPLSITNSFGVPSADPKIWQEDMAKAVQAAGNGQVLIGSFQGTNDHSYSTENYINDFVTAAMLVKETGAHILEANLSCPNEGTSNLLCLDIEKTLLIAKAIREAIGSTPLILKLAYFKNDQYLESFVKNLAPVVDGFAAINTINAAVVDQDKQQILPGKGRNRSGICGAAINWAGLDMTNRLYLQRNKLKMNYTIVGVGGVTSVEDYLNYKQAGADAVMSATQAMWNGNLAKNILESLDF